jgi:competence ComEA-like helix-hairpin-helix protein
VGQKRGEDGARRHPPRPSTQKIIDYRTKNGPFKKIEDIKKVDGIGEKTFKNLKDSIRVK